MLDEAKESVSEEWNVDFALALFGNSAKAVAPVFNGVGENNIYDTAAEIDDTDFLDKINGTIIGFDEE